jgi:hypothetical protein
LDSTKYHNILAQARDLPREEKAKLIEDLSADLETMSGGPGERPRPRHLQDLKEERKTSNESDKERGKTRSIMELQGLRKEIWRDIDVSEYIDRERASWNGCPGDCVG